MSLIWINLKRALLSTWVLETFYFLNEYLIAWYIPIFLNSSNFLDWNSWIFDFRKIALYFVCVHYLKRESYNLFQKWVLTHPSFFSFPMLRRSFALPDKWHLQEILLFWLFLLKHGYLRYICNFLLSFIGRRKKKEIKILIIIK